MSCGYIRGRHKCSLTPLAAATLGTWADRKGKTMTIRLDTQFHHCSYTLKMNFDARYIETMMGFGCR